MRDLTPVLTRRDAIDTGAGELSASGVEHPRLEAERLVAHALCIPRHQLALSGEEPISRGQDLLIREFLTRRAAGEPLQHIEGTVEFRDLVLLADRRALIPRPETEQLVDQVAAWAHERVAGRPDHPGDDIRAPLEVILDVGTGGGAIAFALVSEGVAARAVGLDVSEAALEQARENRARLRLEDVVDLRRCEDSIYDALPADDRFDAIISNPPYIRDEDLAGLATEVRAYDPPVALAGGADGLAVVRAVCRGAAGRLREGGALFLEIAADQGEAVRDILESDGPWRAIDIRRDFGGRDRFAIARF